jgi:hypothetical protein
MSKSTYIVQVYVNKRYITVASGMHSISTAFDKFTAFNRTGDLMSVSTGRSIDSFADRPTRLVSIPSDTGKTIVLRKGRTAAEKIAA